MGQPGFITRTRPTVTTASSLNLQWDYETTVGIFGAGTHIDPAGNLWITDSGSHRVLRFPKQGGVISKTADLVIGQPNFSGNSQGTALNKLYKPQSAQIHPTTGELYVLDGESPSYGGPCRVIIYSPPFANGMSASRELGKALPGNRASGLYEARGFTFDPHDPNAIWVSDASNRRILRIHTQTNAFLDVICRTNFTLDGNSQFIGSTGGIREFGQADGSISFDSAGALHFTNSAGVSGIVRIPFPLQRDGEGRVISDSEMLARGWNTYSGRTVQDQYGMARAGNQLFARDNNRILVWNDIHTAGTYAPADLILNQDSPDTNDPGGAFLGQQPARMHAAGGYLFAGTDDRIFIYATPVVAGGRNATPLKMISANTSDITWADDNQPVPFACNGLCYDPTLDALWLSDYPRNRILRIANPLSATPKVNLVIGQTSKTGSDDNHGLGLYTTDARGIAAPWTLAIDHFGNLYAVDSGFEGRDDNAGNLRVLRFDAAAITPQSGNIFRNPGASGVFCRSTLTANRDQYRIRTGPRRLPTLRSILSIR